MPRLAGQQNEDNSENPQEVAFSWAISVPIEIEEDPRKENQYRNHNSEEAHRRVEWAKRRNEGKEHEYWIYQTTCKERNRFGEAEMAKSGVDFAYGDSERKERTKISRQGAPDSVWFIDGGEEETRDVKHKTSPIKDCAVCVGQAIQTHGDYPQTASYRS